jgi:hypothetical protein
MVNIVDNTWHQYGRIMIEKQKRAEQWRLSRLASTARYFFPIKNSKPRKPANAKNRRLVNVEPYPSRIRELLQRRYG